MSRELYHSPHYVEEEGSFCLRYHMELIGDAERTAQCWRAIERHLEPDSVFCELGTGTGYFSILAASRCRKVYAVEIDKRVLEIAKRNAEQHGLLDKIEFIHANASEVELPQQADVVFCEMMSTWLINEPQVPVLNYAREQLLAPGGVLIPRAVANIFELGEADYKFGPITVHGPRTLFAGVRSPRIITESRVMTTIDFSQHIPTEIRANNSTIAIVPSTVNCVKLSSLVQLADGVNFFSTDSLMPALVAPLEEPIDVKAGDRICLEVQYRHRSRIGDCSFQAKVV